MSNLYFWEIIVGCMCIFAVVTSCLFNRDKATTYYGKRAPYKWTRLRKIIATLLVIVGFGLLFHGSIMYRAYEVPSTNIRRAAVVYIVTKVHDDRIVIIPIDSDKETTIMTDAGKSGLVIIGDVVDAKGMFLADGVALESAISSVITTKTSIPS